MNLSKNFTLYFKNKVEKSIQLQSQNIQWDSDVSGFQLQLEYFCET
jgi:hypothetical protein